MKIGALFHMYPYMHNAGAEMMGHAMLSDLVKRGHQCTVVVDSGGNDDFEPYTIDGVRVTHDKRALNHIDVLLTHLDRTEDAEAIAEKRHIPLVQIFHNETRVFTVKRCDLAVYNTDWIAEIGRRELDCADVIVHPPIWPERYAVDSTREYITLINLQRAKGVEMFYHLAKMMPEHQFLGVKGSYGIQQPAPSLRNLTIIENQKDIREVYAHTKILLMPSSYESYGRCAIEAAVSGIPTIANPTVGLREALGDAGIFPVPDSDSWACAIRYVMERYSTCSALATARAKSLNPQAEMDTFVEALTATVENYAKI